MKTVRVLLLASTTGLIAISGARAADDLAKAKPVEYVNFCPQHGTGFWYVPGICLNTITGSNTGATAYNWQLGGGFSASLWAEGGGAAAAGNLGNNSRDRHDFALDIGTPLIGLGALTAENGSYAMPGLVGNIRIDRSWGSAMLKAALHQNRRTPCFDGTASTTDCGGSPSDQLGWAVGAGFALNLPGLPGSSLSFEANYARGATGYGTGPDQATRLWGDGRSVGVGWGTDSAFRNGSELNLTESWSLVAAGEHRWNPQWRTSIFGGYERIDYNARAEDMICGRGAFAGTASPFAGVTAVSNCNPDFSLWKVGTRTQWNPHPFLDIGLDLMYARQHTAADGARPAGPVSGDQDSWSALFRIQYNMLP